MSDTISFQRNKDDLKKLERQYNDRRPMLTHVATSVKSELEELLDDEEYSVRVSQNVLTARQFVELIRNKPAQHPLVEFTSQINLRIISYGTDDIESIRDTIKTHYHSVQEGWKSDRSQLTLKFLIPPQAKPDGFRDRDDLPNQMQISIAASQSEPRMTTDGDPIPKLALIMKGGGIKGLAYVGALDLLQDEYDFSWFVGTSAGAITAILLAAGYSVAEMNEILKEKNFGDFFDAKWYQLPTNLLFKKGLHPAKAFTDWLDCLLADKLKKLTRVTLGDIEEMTGNRVTVYASQQRKKSLTFDSVDNPDVSAAYAARCSMSIPYFFIPEKDQGILAFDGGLQNNFPIRKLLEDHGNVPFISFFLGAETFEPIKESTLFLQILNVILGQGEDEYVEQYKEQTIVIDPRPVGTLDFYLVDEEKDFLVTCGQIGALKHLVPINDHSSDAELAEAIQIKTSLQPTAEKMSRKRKIKGWLLLVAIVVIIASLMLASIYSLARWWFIS
ncbi:MAG: hypothetical protein CME32_27200 [Gimesia sp.]|nr:hypothetical protein [Gimesia sp.]